MEKKTVLTKPPTVTSLISGGRRRLLYSYEDGSEMVEQYDMKTHQLLSRRTRKAKDYKEAPWIIEVGEQPSKQGQEVLLKNANTNPIFIRKDELQNFQWRVRNLPYPAQTYILDIDQDKQEIIIKTTNKKYYKRFDIPDLKRLGLKLFKDSLNWQYKNSTLVVSYKKPQEVLRRELELRKEFEKLNAKKPKENDIECSTQ